MLRFHVGAVDLAILIGYIVATRALFGWWASRRAREGAEGYFLAGRRMAWPVIGLSFYVSNMSGSTFVGLPGSGYNDGIGVFHYEWLPSVILVFFVFFMLPLYLSAQVYTAPQFLELRYDRRARLAFSGFLLCANVLIDAAAALYAGSMVVQTLLPAIPLWVTVAVASAVAGVYIIFGGLGAVVINDALQALLILIGGTVIAVLAFIEVGSWEAVRSAAPPQALHLIRPPGDEVLPWPGIITGVLVIGIYFWCTNQFIIQRALAARDLSQGRTGALFAGLLKLPNLFILVMPGVIATALYPDLERPDLVFPTLAFDLLPVGLRGVILAALAAAILSSLESILNSAATLFTWDFYRSLRPGADDRTLVRVGRLATVVFMILSALWAPQIACFPTLWQYLQSILAYVTPPVVAVFLLGIFWRRANGSGALLALAAGLPLGASGWLAVEVFGVLDLQFLYASGVMLAVGVLLVVAGSLLTAPPPPERIRTRLWRPALWHEEKERLAALPWHRDPRLLSAVLVALCAVLLVWWW
jgi:SSS family solute:Na+ symporter